MSDPETLILAANGWVPNSPLPVLIHRGAAPPGGDDPAAAIEARFAASGWPPQWRGGIFDFHHYHSTAHEALGIAAGKALLALGGPRAARVAVAAGDVLVLPAGTGHCLLEASADFHVVGAYPPGADWDIRRDAATPEILARIAALPTPGSDPATGAAMVWTVAEG